MCLAVCPLRIAIVAAVHHTTSLCLFYYLITKYAQLRKPKTLGYITIQQPQGP